MPSSARENDEVEQFFFPLFAVVAASMGKFFAILSKLKDISRIFHTRMQQNRQEKSTQTYLLQIDLGGSGSHVDDDCLVPLWTAPFSPAPVGHPLGFIYLSMVPHEPVAPVVEFK